MGREILILDRVDSTSTYLKGLAAKGAPHGLAVLAREQTCGRGRQGRVFASPPGGLYLSVLLRPACRPEELSRLTPWAAAAVREAMGRRCGAWAGIKWVNDLLLGGRKVCGILTELVQDGGGQTCAVLGVGVNLAASREELAALGLGEIATSLAAEGFSCPGQEELAAAILDRLEAMEDQFPYGGDWQEGYRAACVTVGREVLVCRGQSVRPAFALGVEEDFSLRVRYGDGSEEQIMSGEVSIRGGTV